MKRLNNKGFAISTLLYGITIMAFLIVATIISIMSNNRKNTSGLVNQIDIELNEYNEYKTKNVTYKYIEMTDGVIGEPNKNRMYKVKYNGWYYIELCGASGGSSSTKKGGAGACTSGYIYLDTEDTLYFNLGGTTTTNEGGENGGGSAGEETKSYSKGSGGGGATDVRINGTDIKDRIMVAAGGGGADYYCEKGSNGGDGGGLIGSNGQESDNCRDTYGTYYVATGGTQTSAGSNGWSSSVTENDNNSLALGVGGDAHIRYGGGGGAGYFGGGAGTYTDAIVGSGAGGSSYISGYAGVVSFTDKNQSTPTISENLIHYSENYFILGKIKTGIAGNDGDGSASITYVETDKTTNLPTGITKKEILKNVQYIRYCKDNNTEWSAAELQAVKEGKNLAYNITVYKKDAINIAPEGEKMTDGNMTTSPNITDEESYFYKDNSNRCIVINLGSTYDLDEILLWDSSNSTDSISKNHIYINGGANNTWKEITSYLENVDVGSSDIRSQRIVELQN